MIISISYDLESPKILILKLVNILMKKLSQIPISDQYARETASKEVVHRLAGCWTYWGWKKTCFIKYGNENLLI